MTRIGMVSIIGAGLSGLCLAQGLNKRGLPFRVFEAEQTPETRNQGYRISLDENGIRALEECLPTHLFDLFQATSGIPGGSFQMLRGDLNPIFRFRFDLKEGDDPRYAPRQVDRGILRRLLMLGIEDHVTFNRSLSQVHLTDSEAKLFFADGTFNSSELVVGADGARSKLKDALGYPSAKHLGANAIYGRTPLRDGLLDPILANGGSIAIGPPGRAFFSTSMKFANPPAPTFESFGFDGSPVEVAPYVMWAVIFPANENEAILRNPESLHAMAREEAKAFHPAIRRVIDAACVGHTLLVPLRASLPFHRNAVPNATLMGDAVHLMPPFRAQGGNTALLDAADLTRSLARAFEGGSSIASELREYEALVADRGRDQINASTKMMKIMAATNPVLRFALLKFIPWFRTAILRKS